MPTTPSSAPACRWATATCQRSYAAIFDPDTHRSYAKRAGQINPVERTNAMLRHHFDRLTRKSLSLSKSPTNHRATIHAFLLAYTTRVARQFAS